MTETIGTTPTFDLVLYFTSLAPHATILHVIYIHKLGMALLNCDVKTESFTDHLPFAVLKF